MKEYKKKTRAQLRGKQLLDNCQKAKRTTHECGPNDNRIYCYGLLEASTEEHIKQCRECKACIYFLDNDEILGGE